MCPIYFGFRRADSRATIRSLVSQPAGADTQALDVLIVSFQATCPTLLPAIRSQQFRDTLPSSELEARFQPTPTDGVVTYELASG